MSLAIRLTPDKLRYRTFTDIAASGISYIAIGTGSATNAAMTKPIRTLVLQNFTDAAMMISFDGTHDHLPLLTNSYFVFDITSNKTIPQGFFLAEGQSLYVRQLTVLEVPTIQAVYLTTFYGAEI
jgi:hypothetical protein